jgi:catechol 2,3-dioxygenase-like lactoylglutathione lyase family enzyme
MSTMRLFRATLEVGQPEKASTFYRALFGQRPRPVGGGRSYLDCGPTILALISTGERPRGIPQNLYFEVDDLEAVHARASDLGALSSVDVHGRPGGEIVTRPWGERSFYAEDPWGNGLCFVQSGTLFIGE